MFLIVQVLNQEHVVTRRDVEFKIEGVKFCWHCSKSEARVAVYFRV